MKSLLNLAAAITLGMLAGTAAAADKLKVGFIYVGPVGDHGWTYQHDQGRLAVLAGCPRAEAKSPLCRRSHCGPLL